MARLKNIPKELDTPVRPFPSNKTIKWPASERDLADIPRLFRIHRLNTFEWQAYVVMDGEEIKIGKPDVFDLVAKKVNGIMRLEGQKEFIDNKTKSHASDN